MGPKNNMNAYFNVVVNELLYLEAHPIVFMDSSSGHCQEQQLHVHLVGIKGDYPAICKAIGHQGHMAEFGCSKCTYKVCSHSESTLSILFTR